MSAITDSFMATTMDSAIATLLARGFWRSGKDWISDRRWAKVERMPSGRILVKIGVNT
ncbi:MAG: hypothetical protein ACRCUH_08890 [Shewanella sp.]